jgi:uncharacterized membrane protein
MSVFNYIAISISTAGTIVIIWGLIITVMKVLALERRRIVNIKSSVSSETIRHQLSSSLLLGLDFMLAADIIHTIHNPIVNELYILAMIVGIRSVISFFLNREMSAVKLKSDKDEQEQSG